jgi:hypothetical protein
MMTIALSPSTLVRVKDDAGRVVQFRVSVAVDGLYMKLENESDYHGPVDWPTAYALCCTKDKPKRKVKT